MGEAPLTALFVGLLGNFRLVYGDTPVTSVNTPRLQALLAYLILHRHAPQPRHHLAFCFWPDSTPWIAVARAAASRLAAQPALRGVGAWRTLRQSVAVIGAG